MTIDHDEEHVVTIEEMLADTDMEYVTLTSGKETWLHGEWVDVGSPIEAKYYIVGCNITNFLPTARYEVKVRVLPRSEAPLYTFGVGPSKKKNIFIATAAMFPIMLESGSSLRACCASSIGGAGMDFNMILQEIPADVEEEST